MKNAGEQRSGSGKVHSGRIFLILVVAVCCIGGMLGVILRVQTKKGEAVRISISDTGILIENDYIGREYTIVDGHINTSAIINKRINDKMAVELQEGSEDFVIRLFDENAPVQKLNKTGWKISITNGDGIQFPQSESARLIDESTLIHPQISGIISEKAPFTLDLDLGTEQTVSSFGIDKRSGDIEESGGLDGTMGKYKLYVSEDGINYMPAGAGEFTREAYQLTEGAGVILPNFDWQNHIYNMGERVYANFDRTYKTRYVRLVQETCVDGMQKDAFSSAELTLYEDPYTGDGYSDVNNDTITASALIYAGADAERTAEGRKLTIRYEPFVINGNCYDIAQVVILGKDDFYLRSFLEIQASDKEKARIDYIDTNRFVLSENTEGMWDQGMSALGQPIYAGGLFLGSEFPAVHTWISHKNEIQIRYYSGKSFAGMEADGQLTSEGKLVTWQNVIGASTDTEIAVVQADLYQYIEEIAVPTEFRKQYNSWFDNGMEITDETITAAFLGAEHELAENGIEPLDCYVVDDGWNNYYDGIFETTSGADVGTTVNATGFWETNDKFPNEMYTSSELAEKLQSAFGMWLGPQGGYIYDKNFSQLLEASGTGCMRSENAGDGNTVPAYACAGSDIYLKNLQSFLIDYNTKFNITYWKLDGLGGVCQNTDHGHMTGGYCDMYYMSDMWEKWTDLFEALRAARAAEGKELFINATNGVVLSPWILQWVNTVWLGQGDDTGTLGSGERHQQKIYYRDQVYYNRFAKEKPLQFPLGHVYNHDPIYGVSDESSASPEVFREYLFVNAVRGTALWEIYFSPSIMEDEHWQIAADALIWAEENYEVLKNARYFGNDPTEGVYGYASFAGNQAILSFTNPLDAAQTYTVCVDGTLGAKQSLSEAEGILVYPYEEKGLEALSYGDTITVELEPHQTVIRQYGLSDAKAPELISARSEGADTILLRFDERVRVDSAEIDGVEALTSLREDYRSIVLQADQSLYGKKQVRVRVRDQKGNEGEALVWVQCCGEEDQVAAITDTDHIKEGQQLLVTQGEDGRSWIDNIHKKYEALTDNELLGSGAFTICTGVQTEDVGKDLVVAGADVRLSIDSSGYVQFTVGEQKLSSEKRVTTVLQKAYGIFATDAYVPTETQTMILGKVNDGMAHTIAAVREENGMLKLYLDGELYSSCYDGKVQSRELSGGTICIGDRKFKGKLQEVQIFNYALSADEISSYFLGDTLQK